MPIATRAELEAIVGPLEIVELLAEAADPSADAASQEVQKRARLASALQAGDDLIAQFLPLPEPAEVSNVLRRFAIDEALYYLRFHSKGGASASQHEAARVRRQDLACMRKREQMPGSPKGQRTAQPAIVESSSPFAQSRLKGFV